MHILVTGGAGYIGSHTCLQLLEVGYDVTVLDNLVNSKLESLRRVEELAGKKLTFHQIDLLDKASILKVFAQKPVDAVIHFAALKSIGESVAMPLRYFHNNITGSLMLFEAMQESGVRKLAFSSSATVYGDPASVPITEDFPLSVTNPYGRTKLMTEDILRDLHVANPDWSIAILRYFNPIGAHESGRIGEDPNGIPNNLVPYIAQVAVGRLPHLQIFGDDYPTPDGTGVRDYIHVVDLAAGHLKSVEWLKTNQTIQAFNLGTGRGYSVLEALSAFEAACSKSLARKVVARRPGDIAECYAATDFARKHLNWEASFDLEAMCKHAWNWQQQNPQGYP